MSFFDRMLGRPEQSAQPVPVTPSNATDADWEALITALPTAAGIKFSHETALRSPTALAAIRAIAETCGMLAIAVRQRKGEGWEKVDNHPAAILANHWANPWTAATDLRTQLMVDAMVHGAGYAQVTRSGKKPTGLYRLRPGSVSVELDEETGEPSYVVSANDGQQVTLPFRDVVHVATPGSAQDRPMPLVTLAREAIAIELAMMAHQARTFKNGGLPTIVLAPKSSSTPGAAEITMDALKNSIKFFRAQVARNDGAPILLPQDFGEAFKSFGLKDMQFDELRSRVVKDIAAALRVPGPVINDMSEATYSNYENASKDYLQKSVLPWLEVLENAYVRALIDPRDRANIEIEFITRDLLRGDFKSQSEAYRQAGGGAFLTVNEIRSLEGYPPHEDGDGLLKQAGQTDQPNTNQNPA